MAMTNQNSARNTIPTSSSTPPGWEPDLLLETQANPNPILSTAQLTHSPHTTSERILQMRCGRSKPDSSKKGGRGGGAGRGGGRGRAGDDRGG